MNPDADWWAETQAGSKIHRCHAPRPVGPWWTVARCGVAVDLRRGVNRYGPPPERQCKNCNRGIKENS